MITFDGCVYIFQYSDSRTGFNVITMKKIIPWILILFTIHTHSHAQLVDVIHEEVASSGGVGSIPPGYSTYRIYARLLDPTDRISAVFGSTSPDPEHSLYIGSSSAGNAIWNSQFGVTLGENLNCELYFFPDLAWDSFVTIGTLGTCFNCTGYFPYPSDVFLISDPANLFQNSFHPGSTGLAPDLGVNDGAFFVPNDGSCNGFGVGCDYRVLLAQVTVPTGTLEYRFNISIFDEAIGAAEMIYVHAIDDLPGLVDGIYEQDGTCMGLVYPPDPSCGIADIIFGCTNINACNYDANANTIDCSCVYPGCMIEGACNYWSNAACDDGSCVFPGCNHPSACNYDPNAGCDDGSCFFPGCTNPIYCNYDPSAGCDDGTCEGIPGCTNPVADIYDPGAGCDDGSCGYAYSGIIFHDVNSSGTFDLGDSPLSFQQVIIAELGFLAISDDSGNFTIYGIPEGNHTLEVIIPSMFPFNTTPYLVNINVPFSDNTGIEFGLTAVEPVFAMWMNIYPNTETYTCNFGSTHNVCFRNDGNVVINGVIRLDYDPLFTDVYEITPIDSTQGNSIYFGFENLLPGELRCYNVSLEVPNFQFIGYELSNYCEITGYYNNNFAVSSSADQSGEVTCSYDPNDKQAYPVGYSDDHLVLEDTEIEYLIRFQNTGNGPAFNINIRDTIDAGFDLSTFRLVANSHNVQTSLNPITREVLFHFPDIMLPDSTSDEPGSHGFVSYAIEPLENLPQGTQVFNTAHIFFDFNPAVVTNTTMHTIYHCQGQADFVVSDDPCIYEPTNFEAISPYVDTYEWTVDDVAFGSTSIPDPLLLESGDHTISFTAHNPLCTVSSSQEILVNGLIGDFNCSHEVNVDDLLLFIGGFGCMGECGGFDMDNDQFVTVMDLLSFIAAYGSTN